MNTNTRHAGKPSESVKVVVAGLGSEYRRDDGAGPLVAARAAHESGAARDIGPAVDPLDLLGAWDEADLAIIIDAIRSGATPGTVWVIEIDPGNRCLRSLDGPFSAVTAVTSTHGIGLAGVLRLARAVGHAPHRVVVVAIEGADFGQGLGLSAAVETAVPAAVRQVVHLIREVSECA